MSSADLLHRLIEGSVQIVLGSLAAYAVGRLVPALSANRRCWLWRMAALAAIVATLYVLPVGVLSQPAPALTPTGTKAQILSSIPGIVPKATTPQAAFATPTTAVPRETVAVCFWLVGTAIGFFGLGWRIATACRFARKLAVVGSSETVYGVSVVRSGAVPSPLVMGLWRPTVLLPTTGDIEIALAHEMAHVQRRDLLWDAFISFSACVFWPSLVVWFAVREHRQTCEEASDELALQSTGASPDRYANAILEFALRPLPRLAALGTAASDLKRRIQYMNRSRHKTRHANLAIVPALLLLFPARLVASDQPDRLVAIPTIRSTAAGLLSDPAVRREIGLTNEQAERVDEIFAKAKASVNELYRQRIELRKNGATIDERVQHELEARARIRREQTDESLALMSESQAKRLKEIALQVIGAMALLEPDLAEKANLSEKSRARLMDVRNALERELLKYEKAEMEASDQPERLLPPEKRSVYLKLVKSASTPVERKELQALQAQIDKESSLPHAEILAQGRVESLQRFYQNQTYGVLTPEENATLSKLRGRSMWVQTGSGRPRKSGG